MTEKKPLSDREQLVNMKVINIISAGYDYMFERFDRLHKQNIDDDEVVAALRHYGEQDLLDGYAEWGDIDLREDDNTTTNPVVPDPGDAPSYTTMAEQLDAAGINEDNLEQALLDAVKANRIDHGLFFAERSSDGVHWHVYKRRNRDDNGAYIATANDRENAQSILNSLGTGRP